MKYYKKSRLKKCEKKEIVRVLGVLLAAALAVGEGKTVYAAQLSGSVPDDGEELISIDFPVIPTDDGSPFNFILDPQGLINATHAVRYGGRNFEEGATLYFENERGEYDFSHTSDFLTVTNRSTVPVRVRVRAFLENKEGIGLSPENYFGDAEDYLYLALVDDEGGVYPFDREGKAEIVYEMTEQTESGSTNYSFGLTGACNPAADWSLVSVEPHITVTWTAEPVVAEEASEEEAVLPAGQNASAGDPDSVDDAAEECAEDGENAGKSDGAEENGEESSGEESSGTDGTGAEDTENGDGAAEGAEESGAVDDKTEDISISENTTEEGIAQ